MRLEGRVVPIFFGLGHLLQHVWILKVLRDYFLIFGAWRLVETPGEKHL